MTVGKCVFRRCVGDLNRSLDLIPVDRNRVADHIAMEFFEAPGYKADANTATLKNTPKAFVQGINACLQADEAVIELTTEEWDWLGIKATIRITPSVVTADHAETAEAEITLTPSVDLPALGVVAWGQIKIEGSLHWGPPLPDVNWSGRIFRRQPFFALGINDLIQWNLYDTNQSKTIAEEVFEYGQLEQAATTLHLTGECSVQGINSQMVCPDAEVILSGEAIGAVGALIEGLLYMVPTEPSAIVRRPLPSPLNARVTVKRSISDKMSSCRFDYEGTSTGGILAVWAYFSDLSYSIPDYNGVSQPVFCGFFSGSTSTYAANGGEESMVAYDHAWYLTMQFLSDSQMQLLSSESQAAVTIYRLEFVSQEHFFHVGDIVTGATSGDSGKITEVNSYGIRYIIIESPSGGTEYPDPEDGRYYFQDGEALQVNGTTYAWANGHTTDVTGTPVVIRPEDWLRDVLGGDNWETVTGIEPVLESTAGVWGGTVPETDFVFDEKCTKAQAIQQVADYLGFIFVVRPVSIGGRIRSRGFFCWEGDIDSFLGLPAMVTIYSGDSRLLSPAKLELSGELKYNKVTVRCQTLEGVWLYKTLQSTGVGYGDDRPIEFYEINADICTQEDCDRRCSDIYAYYQNMVSKWTMRFMDRSDLQLYQRMTFSGFGSQIPNDLYRIVAIEYVYEDGGMMNEVEITVVKNSDFTLYLNLNRTMTDSISEVQAIVKDEMSKLGKIEAGEITSVDGNKVIVKTERGMTKVGRSVLDE